MTRVIVVAIAVIVVVIAAMILMDGGPSPSPPPPPPTTLPPLQNFITPVLAQQGPGGGCSVKTWPFKVYVSTTYVANAKLTVQFNAACGNVESLKLVNWQRMCVPKPPPSPSPGPSPTPACTPLPFECFEPGCAQPADVTCALTATANKFICDLKPVHKGFYKYRAEIKVATSPTPLTQEPVIEIGDW